MGMGLNSNVSPLIGRVVLATVCVVAVYMVWETRIGASSYARASVGVLEATLNSLPLPPGSVPEGGPKLVDRITIATAEQNYSSDGDPNEIAQFYRDHLIASGWRLNMSGSGAPREMWFCKDGVLNGIAFLSEGRRVQYRVGLTSGGWASSRCG